MAISAETDTMIRFFEKLDRMADLWAMSRAIICCALHAVKDFGKILQTNFILLLSLTP